MTVIKKMIVAVLLISITIAIFVFLLVFFSMSDGNLLFFIPPRESVLVFTIDDYNGELVSGGAEAVADERFIDFYLKDPQDGKIIDSAMIWLKEPVTVKTYTEKNARIDFGLYNLKDKRTKLTIHLRKWSDKPRGAIEGDFHAVLYDFNSNPHQVKGHFKAYQALGTINCFH